MPLKSVVDTVLAPLRRKAELYAEEKSEYSTWISELKSETEVFLERVEHLDFDEAEDRDKLYEMVDQFQERIKAIREKPMASKAPNEVLLKLDELHETLDESSAPIPATLAYVGKSRNPFEAARRRKREEERQQRRIDRVSSDLEEIEVKIREVTSAFDDEP
jgi:chromosome segregation ATPase